MTAPLGPSPRTRRWQLFTKAQVCLVAEYFAGQISRREFPNSTECRDFIRLYPGFGERNPKDIYDKCSMQQHLSSHPSHPSNPRYSNTLTFHISRSVILCQFVSLYQSVFYSLSRSVPSLYLQPHFVQLYSSPYHYNYYPISFSYTPQVHIYGGPVVHFSRFQFSIVLQLR